MPWLSWSIKEDCIVVNPFGRRVNYRQTPCGVFWWWSGKDPAGLDSAVGSCEHTQRSNLVQDMEMLPCSFLVQLLMKFRGVLPP
jgi:hypothetical protein